MNFIKYKGENVMEENEKFGTMVIDGKIVNLDTMPLEELQQLEEKLKKQVEEKKKKIIDVLEENE